MVVATIAMAATAVSAQTIRELTDHEKTIVQNYILDRLRDPESAKFRWKPTNDSGDYCVAVNSKNAFGGYTGFVSIVMSVSRSSDGQITSVFGNIATTDESDIDRNDPVSFEPVIQALERCIAASAAKQ